MLIATAGHVDHGKSALVRALTGVDTDRLPEEKARGLSVDLGFAYHEIGGQRIGFIDVPGHEKFVRTMVAGVMATDAVMLVIAADDGVMPQTREHLAILDLLGMTRGLAVITKTDIAEPTRIEEVEAELRALLAPTGLRDVPVLRVAATRGDGVAEVEAALGELAQATPARAAKGGFRLAIDRSFTLTGAGTVVTGTVYAGAIEAGGEVDLMPAGKRVRLRGLRVQDRDAETARAGDRAALNLAGIAADAVGRGDWITGGQDLAVSDRIEVRLRVLDGLPHSLEHWMPVHVHIGAADVPGHLSIAGERSVAPGETAILQLALDRPVPCAWGDPFILRDQSAQHTLGGGHVIDPFGLRRGRNRPERLAALDAFDQPDHAAALAGMAEYTVEGVPLSRFAATRNLTDDELRELIATPMDIEVIGGIAGSAFHPDHLATLKAAIPRALSAFHEARPDLLGGTTEQLSAEVRPRLPANRIGDLLETLAAEGAVSRRGGAWHLPEHEARPTPDDTALWDRFLEVYAAAGLRPPRVHELAEEFGMSPDAVERFLSRMSGFGFVIRVSRNRFFRPETLRELGEIAEGLVNEGAPHFDAAAFRDASGIGRNLTIELLEFFDRAGLTRRFGDLRELRRPANSLFGSG